VRGAERLGHLQAVPVLHVGYLPELMGHEPALGVVDPWTPIFNFSLGLDLPNSVRLIPLQVLLIE